MVLLRVYDKNKDGIPECIVPPFTRIHFPKFHIRALTVQRHISTFMTYKYEQEVAK